MHLTLTEHADGFSVGPGNHVVYEIDSNRATFGAAETDEHALLFALGAPSDDDALLSVELDIDVDGDVLMRCDRIDFPPGGIAYTHTHPGPGIRCQLFGELTVTAAGQSGTYGPLQPWFERGPDPVYAQASNAGPAAFVRVLILPLEWAGKRTIRYVDPADEDKPKLQRATVFLEERITPGDA